MKYLLVFVIACSSAWALPDRKSVDLAIEKDPCSEIVRQAILTIQVSSAKHLPVSSVELLSAKEDRFYQLKFDGLVGSYKLVLDNDPNNRCFFVRQNFEF